MGQGPWAPPSSGGRLLEGVSADGAAGGSITETAPGRGSERLFGDGDEFAFLCLAGRAVECFGVPDGVRHAEGDATPPPEDPTARAWTAGIWNVMPLVPTTNNQSAGYHP